jgi:emp24/gp25L/p24 family/GOLD
MSSTHFIEAALILQGPKLNVEQDGVYTFCLDNRMARWTAKVVTFDLSVKNPKEPGFDSIAPLKDGATDAETAAHQVAFLKSASARVHSKLLNLENAQFYHYHREKRHRDTLESTNTRVQFWGFVEGIVVLALTAAQVLLIHTWINNSTRTGRGGLPRAFSGV